MTRETKGADESEIEVAYFWRIVGRHCVSETTDWSDAIDWSDAMRSQ